MKENELTPGTVYPVLGTLLFFLPQHLKEKLCCVTPLDAQVNSQAHAHSILSSCLTHVLVLQKRHKPIAIQTDEMDKKDRSGEAGCKDERGTNGTTPTVQETAL